MKSVSLLIKHLPQSAAHSCLSLLDIKEGTIVDGPGLRTAIYAAGCSHKCTGCHNPQSWDIENGRPVSIPEILEIVKKNALMNVTFTGGDPFYQVRPFARLARSIKKETGKNIWCYTGYRFEEIISRPSLSSLLSWIDVLVDGRFEEKYKTEGLRFRGSANQRFIDVPASLGRNTTVEIAPAVFSPCAENYLL